MLIEFQPDLFDESKTDSLERKVCDLEQLLHRLRKSLYARNNELEKMCLELHSRVEIIEKNICEGSK